MSDVTHKPITVRLSNDFVAEVSTAQWDTFGPELRHEVLRQRIARGGPLAATVEGRSVTVMAAHIVWIEDDL